MQLSPGGTLSDYVPFYFTPYSIMLFNIKTGYGGIAQVPNDQIVILVSSLRQLATLGLQFLFTNQHAYPPTAEYFDDLASLDRIDWPLLQRRDFKHDPDDPAKKERYQAEALVWKHVPVDALLGLCCNSPVVEKAVQALINAPGRAPQTRALKTIVRPGWYF